MQGAQYVSEEENSLEDDFELNLTDDVSMHICLLEFKLKYVTQLVNVTKSWQFL